MGRRERNQEEKFDIQPRWLVSLLSQWARRESAREGGGVGYPSKAAFLIIHSGTSARTDPTEYSARDFDELEAAVEELRITETSLWAAVMMYYKPWCIQAFKAEGWPFAPNRVYFDNLLRAHTWIASTIEKAKPT